MMFFSTVPWSSPASTCSRWGLSATRSMNLNSPTVVLPAAVVPSRNSTGARQRRKSLYFSDRIRSAIGCAVLQLGQNAVQFAGVQLAQLQPVGE